METNENITVMSAEYARAQKLTQHIRVHAAMMQENLYEICKGLKEVKEDKLYKAMGYQNFEEYCQEETGFERRQVYRFIAIAENLSENFVTSMSQIGTTKLSLLAMLDEPQRQEIQQTTDLESVTVRELKKQIGELKETKKLLEETNAGTMKVLESHQARNRELSQQIKEYDEKLEMADLEYNELHLRFDEVKEEKDNLFSECLELQDKLAEVEQALNQEQTIEATYTDNSEEIERLNQENQQLQQKLSEARQNPVSVPDVRHELMTLAQIARKATSALMRCMEDHRTASEYSPNYFKTVIDRFTQIEAEQAEKKV